jgi:hypothetical protein
MNMSQPSELFYILSGVRPPLNYLETGCHEGINLEKRISEDKYLEYHSIELDPKWHTHNSLRFSEVSNVHVHLGDSSEILRKLDLTLPLTIFLDAHYSGPGTAMGKMETPLLEELKALKDGSLNGGSVIVIDDIRMLGFKGLIPGNGVNYHPFESDWTDITLQNIKQILGAQYKYLTNEGSWLTDGPEDQLVVFKTSNARGTTMVMLNNLIRFYCRLHRFLLTNLIAVKSQCSRKLRG